MKDINNLLKDLVITKNSQLNEWIEHEYSNLNPCFYSSVDIRNSGSKLAPVDTNLFPGGFNNFHLEALNDGTSLIKKYINKNFKDTKKILIYPEHHTRNLFYLENLANLAKIVKKAGYEIKIALDEIDEEIVINKEFSIVPWKNNFDPDLIILNGYIRVLY